MRTLVFLLVLANLLFFAWTRGALGLGDADAPRPGEPLRADQIRLVSNDRSPEAGRARAEEPSPPAEPPPQPDVCVALSEVPQAEADALERLLAEKLPAFKLVRAAAPGNSSYWVHIPPFKAKREAENKVAELKKLGVKEYFIMQEAGIEGFGISLGLYSTQEAAEAALAAFKEKGVRSAVLAERPRKPAPAQIEVHGPEAQAGEMRQLLAQAMPRAEPGGCGRSAAR